MTLDQQALDNCLKKNRIVAIVMLVGLPIGLLIVAAMLQMEKQPSETYEMLRNILLTIAAFGPFTFPIFKHLRLNDHKKRKKVVSLTRQLTDIQMLKNMHADFAFMYGFIAYIISGDIVQLALFYPIGAIWSIYYWPRKEKFEELLEEIERI